jgi:hypothetical protein
VIDCATDSVLRRIELPDGVQWLCFNPGLHKLFINGYRLQSGVPTDSSVQVYVESLPGGISNQARPQSSVAFSIEPNPARGNVTVRYALAADGAVSLRVLDAQGRLVRLLATGNQPSGEHEFVWNRTSTRGSPVSRGVYFIQLLSRDENLNQKLVVQ